MGHGLMRIGAPIDTSSRAYCLICNSSFKKGDRVHILAPRNHFFQRNCVDDLMSPSNYCPKCSMLCTEHFSAELNYIDGLPACFCGELFHTKLTLFYNADNDDRFCGLWGWGLTAALISDNNDVHYNVKNFLALPSQRASIIFLE